MDAWLPSASLTGWAPLPVLCAAMALLWLRQRATGDAGIVDVGWSAGIGCMAVYGAALSAGYPARRLLVGSLAALWAFRLAGYLLRDRIGKAKEDARYRTLRDTWGPKAQRNFFWFFQAQALLILLFAFPIRVALDNPVFHLQVWDGLGLVLWVVAVGGESLADRQLAAFRRDPANRAGVCDRGLWRYSRHPNYFFEWLHWFAYVLFAVGSPRWAWTLLGPALMFFFLYKVTGIPATEAQSLRSRGDAYRAYQARTSPFIPWFPRREGSR